MITDARRLGPKEITLTPYRVQPYDNRRREAQANGTYADAVQYSHMITDAMRPRPKALTPYRVQLYDNRGKENQEVFTLTSYRVQPYDNRRKNTQAKGTYVDARHSTAL